MHGLSTSNWSLLEIRLVLTLCEIHPRLYSVYAGRSKINRNALWEALIYNQYGDGLTSFSLILAHFVLNNVPNNRIIIRNHDVTLCTKSVYHKSKNYSLVAARPKMLFVINCLKPKGVQINSQYRPRDLVLFVSILAGILLHKLFMGKFTFCVIIST